MKDEFFMSIYCAPALPTDVYPSRITHEVYSRLKELGVKQVYGYYEDEGGVEYVEKSLDLCAAHGMSYYLRLELYNHYLGMKGDSKHPLFGELSKEQQASVNAEFIRWLNKVKDHPGFGGVFIGDERPYETFDGMAVASELLREYCPGKEFHYNAVNIFGDNHDMFYHYDEENRELQLVGELENTEKNRFNRWKIYLDKYLDTCTTDYLSTDIYPFFLSWKEVPTSIHRGLYEISTIFADYKQTRGVSCFHCIGVGDWDMTARDIGRPETALHMNISAAYQLDGYIFFPGMFPNDWLLFEPMKYGAHGEIALLDSTGKPTVHYAYVQRLIEHLQACAPSILQSKWLGVCTVGEFSGGFGDVAFSELEWGDCIYAGGLPENEKYAYTGQLPEIQTSSQLFVGAFENEMEDIYWITNNSIVTDVSFEVQTNADWSLTMDGKNVQGSGLVRVSELNAGESVLLKIKK